MSTATSSQCLGVILAGGESRRMGRPDKFLMHWQGKSLLGHVIDRAAGQVERLVISANGDLERFKDYQLEVLPDRLEPQSGPLAGILSAMIWAREQNLPHAWLVCFASDTPEFPGTCVDAMFALAAKHPLEVVYASSGGFAHYTFSLWSMQTLPSLLAIYSAGERSLKRAALQFRHRACAFDGERFFNVNTPEDWQQLNRAL